MIKPHKYHKNPENQHDIYPNNCMKSSKTLSPPYIFGSILFDQLLILQSFVFSPGKRIIIRFFLTCLVKMYLFLIAYEFFVALYIIECHASLRIVFKFVKTSKRFLKYTSKVQKNFTQTSSRFTCFTETPPQLLDRAAVRLLRHYVLWPCSTIGQGLEEYSWKSFLYWNRQQ